MLTFFEIQQWQTTHLKDNRLACALVHIKTFFDDVIITLGRHQVGHFCDFCAFLSFFHFDISVTSTFFEIEQKTNTHFEVSRLESNFIIVKTLSYYVIITL